MNRLLPLLLAGACIEYGHEGKAPPPDGLFNPPELPATVVVDDIVQVTTPKVDILWVIDNSGSMDDEQDALVANFPAFMDYFLGSGVDYHIGVTSTDLDGNYNGAKGKLVVQSGVKYIEPETSSPIELFSRMATLGTNGSASERGMGATYLALETNRDTSNAGFYRDEAAIHTIVISDEPDYTPASLVTESEFVDWYEGLKDEVDQRSFSSIIDPATGSVYRSLTAELGGVLGDITVGDEWPQLLEELGVQAAGLKQEYFLSQIPNAATITVEVVTVEGVELPPFQEVSDWFYTSGRNSITFLEFVPDPLSHVVVTYEAVSGGVVVDDGYSRP